MQRATLAGATLVTIGAIASPATAFTLPDLSLALSGTYPMSAQGSVANKVLIETAPSVDIEGTGVTLLLLAKALSSLGEFTFTFTKVTEDLDNGACATRGAAGFTAILTGLYHIVPLNTTGTIGLLFLFTEVELKCTRNDFVLSGASLSSLNTNTEDEEQEFSTFGGAILGSKGKQSISEYFNDAGTKVKASFEIAVDKTEPVVADLSVEGTALSLSVAGSKMIVITDR